MANIKNKSKSSAAGSGSNPQQNQLSQMPLGKKNYIFLLIGCGLIILGFILMSGGGSADPDHFDYSMFSFRRITLAPIVVLAGFGTVLFSIVKNFDKK